MLPTRSVLKLLIKVSFCLAMGIAPIAAGAADGAKMDVLQRWRLGGEGGWDYLLADPGNVEDSPPRLNI
jgi:hypothetical protein